VRVVLTQLAELAQAVFAVHDAAAHQIEVVVDRCDVIDIDRGLGAFRQLAEAQDDELVVPAGGTETAGHELVVLQDAVVFHALPFETVHLVKMPDEDNRHSIARNTVFVNIL